MPNPSLVNIFSNYLYSSGLNHDVLTTIIGRFPASAISTIYACATRLSMVEYHEEYFTNTTNDHPQCLGISEPDVANLLARLCFPDTPCDDCDTEEVVDLWAEGFGQFSDSAWKIIKELGTGHQHLLHLVGPCLALRQFLCLCSAELEDESELSLSDECLESDA